MVTTNPNKDDFSHVASFSEKNGTTDETYLYGATIRFAPNGNASENIELKQGPELCPGGSTLLARKAGDKLLAIDYLGGGSAVEFHVLTWVTSGACFINNHSSANGCWGANVLELDPNEAEGGVNEIAISAANNPISDANISAGQFAEFGVNLAKAGILPPGSCQSINQIVWLSRSAGSSFGSQPKDVAVEDVSINVCASVSVKRSGATAARRRGRCSPSTRVPIPPAPSWEPARSTLNGDCVRVVHSPEPGHLHDRRDDRPGGLHEGPGPAGNVHARLMVKTRSSTYEDVALEGALSDSEEQHQGWCCLTGRSGVLVRRRRA